MPYTESIGCVCVFVCVNNSCTKKATLTSLTTLLTSDEAHPSGLCDTGGETPVNHVSALPAAPYTLCQQGALEGALQAGGGTSGLLPCTSCFWKHRHSNACLPRSGRSTVQGSWIRLAATAYRAISCLLRGLDPSTRALLWAQRP